MSRTFVATVGAVLALGTPGRAWALGAIVTDPPGASAAVSVHEAVAAAAGRSVRWGSVEVRGSASTVAWLVPALPGAALDLASDAWVEALEAASAPRVVPPDVDPPCGIAGGVEVEGDFTHTVTVAPGSVVVAADRPTLDAALTGWNLAVTSDLSASVDAAFASGDAIVALIYPQASSDLVTRAVRVVDASPASLPLGLVEAGATPVWVTAYAVGAGSVAVGAGAPLTLDPSQIVWLSDGTSSYMNALDGLLTANPDAWLFETGGHAIVFDGVPVPGASPTPSLVSSYYFRAASYGDATSEPDACNDAAVGVSASDATVAPACPPGALARVAGAATSCQEVVGAGEIDPSSLRCGGIADDVAMALSGLAPLQTWVTRVRGAIAPATLGTSASIAPAAAAAEYGPVVTASAYAQPCASSSGSSGGGSGGTNENGNGSQGSGSGGSYGGNGPSGQGGGGAVTAIVATGNIASAASQSSDGCDGDSSDSGDSCDGDDSDAGSSAGACSGSDDDSGGGCRVGPGGRSPVSRFLLLVIAMATVARRRDRKIRREGLPLQQ